MDCLSCGGRLARSRTTYSATRRGFHLILDDVPAWVCERCGEPLFDESTVTEIQRFRPWSRASRDSRLVRWPRETEAPMKVREHLDAVAALTGTLVVPAMLANWLVERRQRSRRGLSLR